MDTADSMPPKGFRLHEHPWLSLLATIVASIVSIFLVGALVFGFFGLPDDLPAVKFAQQLAFHLLASFVLIPFVLQLPKGSRSLKGYLQDIRIGGSQPIMPLLLLALSCSLILALSQGIASLVYRLQEGYPLSWGFLQQIFDLSGLHPSVSWDLLFAVPSAFEEVAFRGVALTVFMGVYSERKSIIFASVGFSLMHLLNLTSGRELDWVLGQLVWTFILGLFYGYVFVRTKSLWPSMIVHILGNATFVPLSGYMLNQASLGMQILYQIVFTFGLVPTALMILWTRYFTSMWLPDRDARTKLRPNEAPGV